VDIAPTTLGLCGIQFPLDMQGRDYSFYILSSSSENYANLITEPISAYIQLVIPTGYSYCIDMPWRGVVTQDGWKYVCFDGREWLLYHLEKDPYEQVNLAHRPKYAKKKLELNALLQQWIIKTKDSFNLPQLKNRFKEK
jgi:arylsulfatase A-like enzyme